MIGRIGPGHAGGRADSLSNDGIDREGMFGKYRLVLRGQKRPRRQFQHVVGAVAQGQRRH